MGFNFLPMLSNVLWSQELPNILDPALSQKPGNVELTGRLSRIRQYSLEVPDRGRLVPEEVGYGIRLRQIKVW